MNAVDARLLGVDGGDPAAVEDALSGLAAADLPDEEAVLLLRLRAWAAERLGRADEAIALMDIAAERGPEDPELHLQRGVLLEAAGRIDEAVEAFRGVSVRPDEDPECVLTALRYHYLWDRPTEGERLLQSLFGVIRDMGQAGDDFLRGRGLPTFGVLMAHYALFARMRDLPGRTREMLGWAEGALRDAPLESVGPLVAAFSEADPEGYAAWVEAWALEGGADTGPAAARRMAWGLHRARQEERMGAALRHVEAVPADPDAPEWLEDLRTFGRAETLHRFGMQDDEAPWRAKLLRSQPLLFEPEHVVRFGLFEYQERLKEIYRAKRLEG